MQFLLTYTVNVFSQDFVSIAWKLMHITQKLMKHKQVFCSNTCLDTFFSSHKIYELSVTNMLTCYNIVCSILIELSQAKNYYMKIISEQLPLPVAITLQQGFLPNIISNSLHSQVEYKIPQKIGNLTRTRTRTNDCPTKIEPRDKAFTRQLSPHNASPT